MAPFTVRDATRDDFVAMALVWDVAQAARKQIPPPNSPSSETLKVLQTRADKESPRMLVAESNGQPIGLALALQARLQDDTKAIIPGLVHISMVSVLPECWGRGVASALMAEILNKVRGVYKRAQLWTQLTNTRAHDLYIRLGFVTTGEQKVDDGGEEIQLYVKNLE